MSKEYYNSIVAGYLHNGAITYYRLADYDEYNKKFVEAYYNTEDNGYLYEPVSFISRQPKDLYKPVLKRWYYDDHDDTKQYLIETDLKGKIYEAVYLKKDIDKKNFNENEVRKSLIEGFNVSQTVNDEFLLIVGHTSRTLSALLCNRKQFKKKKSDKGFDCLYLDNGNDLEHSVKTLDLYEIKKDSIISIDNLLKHPFSRKISIDERYFYNKLSLPGTKKLFITKKVDDYVITFFSKYFKDMRKDFDLTTKEKEKFLDILESISLSKNYLDQFENKTGYKSEEMYQQFSNASNEVMDVLKKDDKMSRILMNILLNDQEYQQNCLSKVKEEWESSTEYKKLKDSYENQLYELMQSVEDENKQLEDTKSELKTTKPTLEKVKSELNKARPELEKSEKELKSIKHRLEKARKEESSIQHNLDDATRRFDKQKDRLESIKKDIDISNTQLENVKNEINNSKNELEVIKKNQEKELEELEKLEERKVEVNKQIKGSIQKNNAELIALIKESIPNVQSQPTQVVSQIGFVYDKNTVNENVDSLDLEDYTEAFDFLTDNLELYYTDNRRNDITASIFSSIANRKAIVVDEILGEKIADSISYMIDAKKADKYTVYNTDVDAQLLLHSISDNDSSIIYFDGILNSYNETLLKLIVKSFPSKVLIFGVDEENIPMLSKGIWKFACYIDANEEYLEKTDKEILY